MKKEVSKNATTCTHGRRTRFPNGVICLDCKNIVEKA